MYFNFETTCANEIYYFRYHLILIQTLIYSGDYTRALSACDDAIQDFHNSNVFKFLKGVTLKISGNKKEANKLLRYIHNHFLP